MGAMTSFHHFVPLDTSAAHRAGFGAVRRRGVFRRIFDAVARAHQRKAEREVERYLGLTGQKFTDEVERQVIERLMRNDNLRP